MKSPLPESLGLPLTLFYNTWKYEGIAIDNSDEILSLLEEDGDVVATFTGHNHVSDKLSDGWIESVNGTTHFSLREYLRVTLNRLGDSVIIKINGKIPKYSYEGSWTRATPTPSPTPAPTPEPTPTPTPTEPQTVTFPDEKLAAAVRYNLHLLEGEKITTDDLTYLSGLVAEYSGIADLSQKKSFLLSFWMLRSSIKNAWLFIQQETSSIYDFLIL